LDLPTLNCELRAHLFRLGGWALVSLVAGLILLGRNQKDGAGGMTLIWAVINLVIVGFALRGTSPADYGAFRAFLTFNLGLNLLWIASGVAMALNRQNVWVQRAGWAMVVQAVVLMALDLYLFVRTRR